MIITSSLQNEWPMDLYGSVRATGYNNAYTFAPLFGSLKCDLTRLQFFFYAKISIYALGDMQIYFLFFIYLFF